MGAADVTHLARLNEGPTIMSRITFGQFLAVACIWAIGVDSSSANPTGGVVASGTAGFSNPAPGTLQINQASTTAIINWQTFSIASGETTSFVAQNANSAVLNRVLGGQTSIINGNLTANEAVYLVNGNGIFIGPSGMINANSFTASTRDINDNDFLSGNLHFTGNNPNGVTNQGTISTSLGDVYLIGKTVDNQGTINTPNGTTGLASGDDVVLNLNGDEHVFVSPSATASSATSQTAVHNSGTITAATAELKAANGNLFALAINNEGAVRATSVANVGGHIFLTTDSGLVQNTGTLASKSGSNGGSVKIVNTKGSVWNRQTIDASGAQGGQVTVNSQNFQNDGTITVAGTAGAGGSVGVTYSGNALGSVTGIVDASGTTQGGSIQFLGTGNSSEAYLSLTLNAGSSGGAGGSINIDAPTVFLTGATLTANGATAGGRVYVGEGDPISSPGLSMAQTTYVSTGTTISANGGSGKIGVSGTTSSKFFGTATAANGQISIIGPGGVPVTLGGTDFSFEFVDPDASPTNMFGQPSGILNLSSNNSVISSPGDSFAAVGAGAVYLFSDANGALLSTLRGSHTGDAVGTKVQTLSGGNFAVLTPNWNGSMGSVTFGNGVTGFAAGDGTVSAANSLVGGTVGDKVGSGGIFELSNSPDYLVLSSTWAGGAGAVTWNGATGTTGVVSSANSLVGSSSTDGVGSTGSITDSMAGYYLVTTLGWNGGAGAVTWNDSTGGTTGQISSENSLVGSAPGDNVGGGGITFLQNSSYVVLSPNWSGNKGAATWGSAESGVSGAISSENSLVGSASGDMVGSGGVTPLTGGNYLVVSPNWSSQTGAVTWGSQEGGISGTISSENSLTGANPGDLVGSGGIVQLGNGANYLVLSPSWSGEDVTGAITNGRNANGVTGTVSSDNSLVDTAGATIVDSNNGYYLVVNPNWNNSTGAVTWSGDAVGTTGFISSENSLIGSTAATSGEDDSTPQPGDQVGSGGVTILANGNYVVDSPNWNDNSGAVTWGSGIFGAKGTVSSENSLTGSISDSSSGEFGFAAGDQVGSGGITALLNGNYLVSSPTWNGGTGAVTWGDGSAGVTGSVSSENSLAGLSAGDQIGSGGILELSNGANYLVLSPDFAAGMGAITNGSSSSGVTGIVSDSNSLLGASTNDHVGSSGSVFDTLGGYYLVRTANWGGGAGAVTWNNDDGGTVGKISASNSLVGSSINDSIGNGGIDILYADHDNYVVVSPNWNGNAGAVTWGSATSGVSGVISSANSIVGATSGVNGDEIGSDGISALPNGNYLILSPDFGSGAGAVTFAQGGSPILGTVGVSNSFVGGPGEYHLGVVQVVDLNNGNFLLVSSAYGFGAGAVTFGNGNTGVKGQISSANSLVGTHQSDHVGSGGIIPLPNGDYLVLSPFYSTSTGAATWGSGTTGVSGVVGTSNSLTGGGPNSGEKFAGFSSDGSIYLVSFTTDTSAGGDGRVFAGSIGGPTGTGGGNNPGIVGTPNTDFFMDQAVLSFEVSGENLVYSDSEFYISDPGSMTLEPVSVDSLTGGAVNDGNGNNIASGSSTSGLSGPQRLVTPDNGIWNIFNGAVHSMPPPTFVQQQLHLVLSPNVYAELTQILFGSH